MDIDYTLKLHRLVSIAFTAYGTFQEGSKLEDLSLRYETSNSSKSACHYQFWTIDNNPGEAFLTFRGTFNMSNVYQDICSTPYETDVQTYPHPGPNESDHKLLIHSGFMEAYKSLRLQLLKDMKELQEKVSLRSLCITGHSLGGALATIALFDLEMNNILAPATEVECWTFGAPAVGDANFVRAVEKYASKCVRFYIVADPIPYASQMLGNYIHIGTAVPLDDGEKTVDALQLIEQRSFSLPMLLKCHRKECYLAGIQNFLRRSAHSAHTLCLKAVHKDEIYPSNEISKTFEIMEEALIGCISRKSLHHLRSLCNHIWMGISDNENRIDRLETCMQGLPNALIPLKDKTDRIRMLANQVSQSWCVDTYHITGPEMYSEISRICDKFDELHLLFREIGIILNPSTIEHWKIIVELSELYVGIMESGILILHSDYFANDSNCCDVTIQSHRKPITDFSDSCLANWIPLIVKCFEYYLTSVYQADVELNDLSKQLSKLSHLYRALFEFATNLDVCVILEYPAVRIEDNLESITGDTARERLAEILATFWHYSEGESVLLFLLKVFENYEDVTDGIFCMNIVWKCLSDSAKNAAVRRYLTGTDPANAIMVFEKYIKNGAMSNASSTFLAECEYPHPALDYINALCLLIQDNHQKELALIVGRFTSQSSYPLIVQYLFNNTDLATKWGIISALIKFSSGDDGVEYLQEKIKCFLMEVWAVCPYLEMEKNVQQVFSGLMTTINFVIGSDITFLKGCEGKALICLDACARVKYAPAQLVLLYFERDSDCDENILINIISHVGESSDDILKLFSFSYLIGRNAFSYSNYPHNPSPYNPLKNIFNSLERLCEDNERKLPRFFYTNIACYYLSDSPWLARCAKVKGVKLLEYAADGGSGDPAAIRILAVCYFCGNGIDKDESKACELLNLAAKRGDEASLQFIKNFLLDDK